MNPTPAQLAAELVNAIGRPDDMVELLADDVTWWLPPSVPSALMQHVTTGRHAVRANLQRLFAEVYEGATMRASIHSAISENQLGTVRFTLAGQFSRGGHYENDYCLCVEARTDKIAKVWEYVDIGYALAQAEAAGLTLTAES